MARRLSLLSFLGLLIALPPPGFAAEKTVKEGVAAQGLVREIIDGDTLILESGDAVRLVGVQAPKLSLGRPRVTDQPLAAAAKRALAEMALGKKMRLRFFGRRHDRHGRLLAHLFVVDGDKGEWVQGRLLAQGLARVYSFADNRARVAEMLALERAARAQKRGIWAHPFYQVIDVQKAGERLDRFELVEGRVRKAAVVKGRGYLNFGDDWREDFTIVLAPKVRRAFEREGIDISAYAGKRVRVRGWITRYNGPMIEATHPEQIERLSD